MRWTNAINKHVILRALLFVLLFGTIHPLQASKGSGQLKTIRDSVFVVGDKITLPVAITAEKNDRSGPEMKAVAMFLTSHPELFFQVTVYHEQKSKDSLLFVKRAKEAQRFYDTLVAYGVPFERLSWSVARSSGQKMLPPPALELKRVLRSVRDSIFHPGDCIPFYALYGDGPRMRPEMKDSLEVMLKFVQQHPELTFEITSHTDSRGSDAYNVKLSQRRAEVIRDYLLQNGVYPPRIIAKGYGESAALFQDQMIYKFKTKQEQEQLHQQNRRTELRILTNAGRH